MMPSPDVILLAQEVRNSEGGRKAGFMSEYSQNTTLWKIWPTWQ